MWITANWKILKEMRILDYLTCLLRNLYADQDATVKTRYETMELVGSKLVRSTSRLYIVILLIQLICSARHVKCQAVWITIWNQDFWEKYQQPQIRDDTTHMAEVGEEPKSLLMGVKDESEKVGLILNIQKIKIMASGPNTSWQIQGEKIKPVTDFIFLGS